jgi:hypothetical protein
MSASALIKLKTNLKSLRYGQDRVGGGNSNQPYIKSPIPDNASSLDRSGGVDFLLRGGTLTPSRAIQDVSRLTKMFFDFKSPNGVLFTAKQNLLSRTGVKTQASGILNEGVYLPTSTLLQVAGNAFGTHLLKQGINPARNTSPDNGAGSLFGLQDPLGLPVYTQNFRRIQSEETNRLVQLKYKKIGADKTNPTDTNARLINNLVGSNIFSILLSPFNQISSEKGEILKYGGGPGSILGIGKTILKRYSDTNEGETKASTAPKSTKNLYGKTFFPNITPAQTVLGGVFALGNAYRSNLYTNTNSGLDFDKVGNSIFKGKYYVLDSSTVFKKTKYELSSENTQISDFRTQIPSTQIFAGGKKNILSAAPDYTTKNIENRVNLGDPGKRSKDVSSYTKGTGDKLTRDLITAMPLYKSAKADHGGDRNDLVKFSIGIIDNDSPSNRTYIHFRAFLDSMDDQYNAEWNNFKYMGRGENFYRYNGFTRTINLGWTIAAQSKEELIPMYQKLNFLASSLTPDYSANGYMRGNLAVLTIGGYLFEQPGIINSINYSVPTESPWEIGISDTAGFDHTVKEMPHIIKVTGFSFTPIQEFVPKLQKNTYEGVYGNKNGNDLRRVISGFGKERYIALSRDTDPNATTTNYNPPNDYTFGVKGIAINKPPLPNPNPPQIPTSLARRGSGFNTVPVPARNSIVAAPNQPPINTNAAVEDIRQATQIRNLRF